MVTRRLFKSGESEYFINKIPCRMKDIVELFMDSGVGANSYSIMEQGKVDFILSLKPSERRLLIEEAAGISKYRARMKEAVSKMGSTKNNLIRLNDIVSALQNQMRGLELQVKRLKRFKNIKEEIRKIDLMLASIRQHFLNNACEQHNNKLTEYREVEIKLSTGKSSAESGLEKSRLDLTELQNTISELNRICFAAKENIQNEENKIKLNEQELNNSSSMIDKNIQTVKEIQTELSNINNEIKSKNTEQSAIAASIEDLENKVSEAYAAQTLSKNSLSNFQDMIEDEKNNLFKTAHEITETKNAIILNKRLHDEILLNSRKITEEKENCTETILVLEQKIALLKNEIIELTSKRDLQEKEKLELDVIIASLSESFQEKDSLLSKQKDSVTSIQARLQSLQDMQKNLEGFDKGVRTIIGCSKKQSSELNGISGLIADVIETDPQYEQAVEAVLDRKLQSIIVQTHNDALHAINHLKAEKSGRASFLPMTVKKERSGQPVIEHCIPLASIIKAKDGFQNIIEALLEKILFTENIALAIDVFNNNSLDCIIVTRQGEIVEPSGVVTGGSCSASSSGILKRNREIKEYSRQLIQFKEQIQVISDEKEQISAELQIRRQRFDTLCSENQLLDNKIFQQKTNHEHTEKELLSMTSRLHLLSSEESENKTLIAKYENELKILQEQEIAELESHENKELLLNELQQKETSLKNELEKSESIHTELRLKLASAQQKLENVLDNINRISENKENLLIRIDTLQKETGQYEENTKKLTHEINRSKEQLNILIDKGNTLETQIVDKQTKADELVAAIEEKDNMLKDLRKRWDDIEPEIHNIDKEISLCTQELKHLSETVFEKYCLTSDQLPSPPEHGTFNEDESEERLVTLNKRLESIGDVNPGAAREYEELDKKLDFFRSHEQDLLQSIDHLQKIILKINSRTKQKFSDTFNEINAHFQELFPLLFNGGKAYMQLTDESDLLETGIDVFARPPGKKLQGLELLSGGERALTVIAIMFAIFLTKPSPFCLMDEIDAPLDDSNIGRFILHLQKMAVKSQFIIITHNKLSMQAANSLYGVTMQERGVSKIVSVDLN